MVIITMELESRIWRTTRVETGQETRMQRKVTKTAINAM
jgi:hypothetical protein